MDGDFTWRVKDFTQRTEQRLYSKDFEVGTYTWRMLLYPRGNGAGGNADYIAVYLDFAEAEYTPTQFCPNAHFLLVAVNQINKDHSVMKEAAHVFSGQARDWGFTKFLLLEDALNAESGFVRDDTLVLKVKISVRREHVQTEPGRRWTGFVGLKCEGSCCMNSVVRFLYHIPILRKAVYRMTTPSVESHENSTHGALQELFYKLQYQDSVVSTEKLTQSLGFGKHEMWILNDLRKLREVLFSSLEENMKVAGQDSAITQLFVGYYSVHIQCLTVDYESLCKQPFKEICLDAGRCTNVYESLEELCAIEKMEGPRQLSTKQFGFQDARRTTRFDSLPSVLQLHLKGTGCGNDNRHPVKNSVRYKILEELDLDHNGRLFQSKTTDRTVCNKYRLHSVFTHTSSADGNVYGILIQSNRRWYRFENEFVTEVPTEAVISSYSDGETQGMDFGHPFGLANNRRPIPCSLVYVRCSDWDRIMCRCSKEDIEEPIRRQYEAELSEERKRKDDKEKAHLYVVIKLATERHFLEQVGSSRYFDLVDFSRVSEYRLHKKTRFEDFKERVSEEFGIPTPLQRFWSWKHRSNGTVRVDEPLDCAGDRIETVLDLKIYKEEASLPMAVENALMTIQLFLEAPDRRNILRPLSPNELLIFVKLYDPKSRKLSYVGHLMIGKDVPFSLIFEHAKLLAKLPQSAITAGFREITHKSTVVCSKLMPAETPEKIKMVQGDIIIIQERVTVVQQLQDKIPCPTAKSFLECVLNVRVVTFRRLEHATEDGFKLELMKTMTYEQVTAELARYLMLDDPLKIRLTQHDASAQLPCSSPIEYNGINTLEAMIAGSGQHSNILYYELLDIQLPNLENTRHVVVSFHNQKAEFQSQHRIQLQKDQTVGDLVKELRTELGEGYIKSDVRVMEVLSAKVVKVFANVTPIKQLTEWYGTLRAEAIPEDEKDLDWNEYLVHCCHCKPFDTSLSFYGDPVWIRIRKGETLRDLMERVQAKLEIPDEEFSTWKFSCHSPQTQQLDFLNEGADIISRFSRGFRNTWKRQKRKTPSRLSRRSPLREAAKGGTRRVAVLTNN